MTYVKLFGSILDSTVWNEPGSTRLVWITMLAMADQHGCIWASVPGLAKRAGVERAECERALACFTAPDPDSRTKDFEGRRIEAIDGGWILLNHGKFREMLSAEDQKSKATERQRRHRESKGPVTLSVTPCHASSQNVTPVTTSDQIKSDQIISKEKSPVPENAPAPRRRGRPKKASVPLPFTLPEALDALAAGGRFVATPLEQGPAIAAQSLIRRFGLGQWRLAGEWLAAGGESYRDVVDSRALSQLPAWIVHAEKWHASGRPRVAKGGTGQLFGNKPLEPMPAITESETSTM